MYTCWLKQLAMSAICTIVILPFEWSCVRHAAGRVQCKILTIFVKWSGVMWHLNSVQSVVTNDLHQECGENWAVSRLWSKVSNNQTLVEIEQCSDSDENLSLCTVWRKNIGKLSSVNTHCTETQKNLPEDRNAEADPWKNCSIIA